ncbi:MAG: hypothetical protein M0C28_33330 [Candidatus Moduliflexus flocculans]|nr:hypothetical protein [Candidatus Moduliflexus flocculans]
MPGSLPTGVLSEDAVNRSFNALIWIVRSRSGRSPLRMTTPKTFTCRRIRQDQAIGRVGHQPPGLVSS